LWQLLWLRAVARPASQPLAAVPPLVVAAAALQSLLQGSVDCRRDFPDHATSERASHYRPSRLIVLVCCSLLRRGPIYTFSSSAIFLRLRCRLTPGDGLPHLKASRQEPAPGVTSHMRHTEEGFKARNLALQKYCPLRIS
jgi:hypothetical protein